ncbi:hypothetical protein D5086_003153 [Populus alba]|uniref:Uncharacterized protein n=1 Tax=Populus alba TaxID=43335 RepID=A0ACC4D3Y5_POPAL
MAAEVARKGHELNETEELVYDLESQNETLMANSWRRKVVVAEEKHKGIKHFKRESVFSKFVLIFRNQVIPKVT